MSTESERVKKFGRLEDGLRQAGKWYRWGPYVSERQWGTVREDYSAGRRRLGLPPPRPGPLPGLPLGRGRPGRVLRHRAAPVPRPGPVERARPDPQGAALRPHRGPGQPRRGRQGVLVVPRRRCPATPGTVGATTTPRQPSPTRTCSRRTAGAAGPSPSTSCSTPASSTRTGTGSSRSTTPRPTPHRPAACEVAGHQRRSRGRHASTCCRPPGSATRGRGTSTRPSRRLARPRAPAVAHRAPLARRPRAAGRPGPRRRRARDCCSARTRPTRPALRRRPDAGLPQGRHQRPRGPRRADRQPASGRAPRRAFWYHARRVAPGQTAELRLRLRPADAAGAAAEAWARSFDRSSRRARAEADEFYAELTAARGRRRRGHGHAPGLRRDAVEQAVLLLRRAALARRRPDPAAAARRRELRAATPAGGNFDAFDIMSMPDKWEYPWFAAWDLAFHCVALAHVDPAFAKYQLILLCREWFQHPNGALPAYEWDFGDVNPPVQAWAALEVFAIDGGHDLDFLSRIFDKLMVNFTWWVNREDADGNNLFEGGFLGPGQHRPDRPVAPARRRHASSRPTPPAGWRSTRCRMVTIAADPQPARQRPAADLVLKFLEHFALIVRGPRRPRAVGRGRRHLLRPPPPGRRHRASRSRSAPWSASSPAGVGVVDQAMLDRADAVGKEFAASLRQQGPRREATCASEGLLRGDARPPAAAARRGRHRPARRGCSPAVRRGRVPVPLRAAFPLGLPPRPALRARAPRASTPPSTTSRPSRPRPCSAATPTGAGPVWFPLNYLVVSALERYGRFFGDEFTVEYPDRIGPAAHPGRDRRRPAAAPDLDLPPRRQRAPALLRRVEKLQPDPSLAGQRPVQRVLPRRQRRRPRRHAPDRLDRPGGRPDPPRHGAIAGRRSSSAVLGRARPR